MNSQHLFTDETTAPVLDPGRGVTKTGYLWAPARDDRLWGGDDLPGVVYFYAPGRAGENAETFLSGFDGILQIYGYTGYPAFRWHSSESFEAGSRGHLPVGEGATLPVSVGYRHRRNDCLRRRDRSFPVGPCRAVCRARGSGHFQ
jgi:hypothetical protein